MRHLLTLFVCIILASPLSAETVESFDDIVLWTGSGANEAALVIDFDGASTTDRSYAWGFRWDGDQTIEDMLLDIVRSDNRLFLNVDDGTGTFGRLLRGIGYDLNGNETFGTTNPVASFDEFGIAITDELFEGSVETDSGDRYREGFGFSEGFWTLGNSIGNPYDGGSWIGSPVGISGIVADMNGPTGEIRYMSDGDWASLAWNTDVSTFAPVFSRNTVAAIPEPGFATVLAVATTGILIRRRRRN